MTCNAVVTEIFFGIQVYPHLNSLSGGLLFWSLLHREWHTIHFHCFLFRLATYADRRPNSPTLLKSAFLPLNHGGITNPDVNRLEESYLYPNCSLVNNARQLCQDEHEAWQGRKPQ